MSRSIFAVLTAALVLVSFSVSADDHGNHGRAMDTILAEIRSELNIDKDTAIDPEKVSEESLEKLGEAVMSLRIPDPQQHEWMDNMMGGEGSERLADMHKVLGYRYLATGGAEFGPYMMLGGLYGAGSGRMIMEGGLTSISWMLLLIMLSLLLVIAVVVVYLLIRNGKKYDPFSNDPLVLLKEKYVKGEISREEYLEKKRDLIGD